METDLEKWLWSTGALALKGLADQKDLHGAPKPKVIAFILGNPEAKERATESMRLSTTRLEVGECLCHAPAHKHGDLGCLAPARGLG